MGAARDVDEAPDGTSVGLAAVAVVMVSTDALRVADGRLAPLSADRKSENGALERLTSICDLAKGVAAVLVCCVCEALALTPSPGAAALFCTTWGARSGCDARNSSRSALSRSCAACMLLR